MPQGARPCDTVCYKCLLRYGNQPYHGLLDWQLGLTYLRAMVDPLFRCGLDGNFSLPGLSSWPSTATRLADEMASRFRGEAKMFGIVPAFRMMLGKRRTPWVLVAHPLWDWDESDGPVGESKLSTAFADAISEEGAPVSWDTFNLQRRQVLVRERVRERLGA